MFVRVITRVICCLIYVRIKHSGGAARSAFTERSVCVFLSCVLELPKWTQPDKKNDFEFHLILQKQMYR